MIITIFGLRVTTKCQFIKFTQSNKLIINEDILSNCMRIVFPEGCLSDYIVDNHVEVISKGIPLESTDYIKINNPIVSINGLKFIKTAPYNIQYRQFIVSEVKDFTMILDGSYCEVLVPRIKNSDYKSLQCLWNKNPHFRSIESDNPSNICNCYSLDIKDEDIDFNSDNDEVFNVTSRFSEYLISDEHVLQSFKSQLTSILNELNIELVRLPVDKNVKKVHRLTYRITEFGTQLNYKGNDDPLRYVSAHRSHIDFQLSTPDIRLFLDFRNRYQNLDLISNLTQFYTVDKLNGYWRSSAFWSSIDTSFNQDYSTDDLGNTAHGASFSVDLYYYIARDERYKHIKEIITEIESGNSDKIIFKV